MRVIKRLHAAGKLTDQEAVAAARFAAAPNDMNLAPSLYRVLHDLISKEMGLEEVERRRGWPDRSAKVVLRVILDALVERGGDDPTPPIDPADLEAREKLAFLTDDLDEQAVSLARKYRLTPAEAVLLSVMSRAKGRTRSKEFLVRAINANRNPDEIPAPKLIDVMVCKIRHKLDGGDLQILTDWGLGYRLEDRPVLAAQDGITQKMEG